MTEVVTPAAGSLAADPAFAAWDAETQGAFKNNGWDSKPPAEAAFEAMKSFRETQRHLGIPKDRLLALPKDASDEAGWKTLRSKLGVPDDAKGYSFADIKRADGSAPDTQLLEAVAPALHAAGVPKDRAPEVVSAVVKFLDSADTTAATQKQAALVQERDALAKDWGPNKEANMFIAKQAALKIGMTQAEIDALESAAGYKNTMGVFLKLGQLMGEDKFINSPAGGGAGVMTADQAAARMKDLQADTAWGQKLLAGDAAAMREFNALTTLMQRRAA
jgi:hypothetical protein